MQEIVLFSGVLASFEDFEELVCLLDRNHKTYIFSLKRMGSNIYLAAKVVWPKPRNKIKRK